MHQHLAQQEAEGCEDPAISFFELVQQLKRAEAVKLFVQVRALYSLQKKPDAFKKASYKGLCGPWLHNLIKP